MDYIAKEEIEDGDRIDCVEYHGALVEDKFGPCVVMGLWNKADQIIVHNVAEEEVQGDSETPAKHDLIVGMYTMVESAECDHKTSKQREDQTDNACFSIGLESSIDKIPDRQIERCRGDWVTGGVAVLKPALSGSDIWDKEWTRFMHKALADR